MIYYDIKEIKGNKVPVAVADAVKLKRPSRVARYYDLKEYFGFIPSKIIVQLEHGRNNSFHLIAIDENGETKQGKELLNAITKGKNANN